MLPNNINIATSLDRTSTTLIDGNTNQIRQVIINLIMNAKEAMPNGGSIRIKISSNKTIPPDRKNLENTDTKYACLEIRDSGVGIKASDLNRIFEPNFTTKKDNNGLGLGLPIAYTIINNHLGLIKVDSTSGQGTVFSLYFPISNLQTRNSRTN